MEKNKISNLVFKADEAIEMANSKKTIHTYHRQGKIS